MPKLTPPGPAGSERLTTKVNTVVPELPSLRDTSLTDKVGRGAPVWGVIEKSSTASPSSAPVASASLQRIQKHVPSGIFKPVIVDASAVRSAAALPFLAPLVTVSGVTKFNAVTFVHV